jgi:cytosine/adenosine deaminase-related metal-dependent hydrolase
MPEILLRSVYHLATLDPAGTRAAGVDVLVRGGKIAAIGPDLGAADPAAGVAVGSAAAPTLEASPRVTVDASRCVAIPGMVNTHHHLFQTMTRAAPPAQNAKLFDWLVTLYAIWRNLDPEVVYWGTLLGAGELALTGCTTTTDHHYLFPRGAPGDLLDAQLEALHRLGLRRHVTRGSMSVGESRGGLPPDDICQDEDTILADCERVVVRWHDPRPSSMCRIALAPCAPFSVSEGLLRATASLARARGVRLHTHLAETEDENAYCLARYGIRPLEWMRRLDWLGPDVWFAHGIYFDDAELDLLAATSTGIAHCPSSNMRLASGIARLPDMLSRGIPVGLGVDGSSSNDSSNMLAEVRQAMLLARVGHGPQALGAEAALRLATQGGARLLGRADELGRIEVGRPADLTLFDVSGLDRAGALSDPLAALVFTGISQRAQHVIVNGEFVVRDGRLVTVDEDEVSRQAHAASFRLFERAGVSLPWGRPPWLPP